MNILSGDPSSLAKAYTFKSRLLGNRWLMSALPPKATG
jgi:hypothetical protein